MKATGILKALTKGLFCIRKRGSASWWRYAGRQQRSWIPTAGRELFRPGTRVAVALLADGMFLAAGPKIGPKIRDGQTHHQGHRAPSTGRGTSAIWKATCLGVTQGWGEKPWLWGTAQRTISLWLAFPEVSWRVRTLNLPWVLYRPAMKQLSSNSVKFLVVSTGVSFTLNC